MEHFILKVGVGSIPPTLYFVGWVEPTAGFVGFLRLRRINLQVTGFIAKCETQQKPISKPSFKNFFIDQNGRCSDQRRR